MVLLAIAGCATGPSTVAMISANAEWKVVVERSPGLPIHATPYGDWLERELAGRRVIFFHGGYGKVNAAGSTQYAIDRWHPRLVLNLGTCGAFGHDLHVGDVVLAKTTTIYDIYEAMGDADEAIAEFRTQLDVSRWPARLASRVRIEPLISADRDLIPAEIGKLRAKYDAGAGDWESGAIAYVATKNHTRAVILRGVTDVLDETHPDPTYGNEAAWQRETATIMAVLLELAGDALPDLLE
ncbi:MAG TPA: 5'-methylthioadenosine/S-adenosylhomocysteine nucleosidase [Kofleriaceae bacterium]|jgi:adenosylhomocysteine nucleosidase